MDGQGYRNGDTRGRSKPPEAIRRFIDLLNGENLFDRTRQLPEDDNSLDFFDNLSPVQRVQNNLKLAETLTPTTRKYLGPPEEFEKFSSRYRMLQSARSALLSLADRYRSDPTHVASAGPVKGWKGVPFGVYVEVVVADDGKIALADNLFLNTMIGVSADRVRSCSLCRQLFWARRVNSECCGERCRKAFNQRNSRQNRRQRLARRKAAKKGS